MAIDLDGKSLEDLIKIPLTLGNERLSVQPHQDNEVYVVDGHFFHYQLIPEEPPEMKEYGWDITTQLAGVGYYTPFSDDSWGNQQSVGYWGIELWDKIPEEWRDIFVYHEIIEALSIENGFSREKAHALAKQADTNYRQKYLSDEQQEQFEALEQRLLQKA